MHNFVVRLIASFIPKQSARRAFREKYSKKNIKDKINELDEKINVLYNDVKDIEFISNTTVDIIKNIKDMLNQNTLSQNSLNNEIRYIKNFLQVTTDITKIPKAYGILELIQKSELVLLKRFDIIARKHDIKYWLDAGTLVGAVVHNGFVPWDDDIDICVLRSDYEKLEKILNDEFVNQDFHFSQGDIIRCFYKKAPTQLDILPIDQGWQSEALSGEEKQDFVNKLNEIKSHLSPNWFPNLEQQIPTLSKEDKKLALAERDKLLLDNHKIKSNGFCYSGVETFPANRTIWSYDDIFPLEKFTFCEIDTFIPHKSKIYLYKMYGDFMKFPCDMYPKHTDIQSRINSETIKDMKDLIKIK